MKFRELRSTLAAVQGFFEEADSENPIYRLWEDGEIGDFEAGQLPWEEVIGYLRETCDDLGEVPTDAVVLYRQVVDTLASDGGKARRANHQVHTWEDGDLHQVCVDCGEAQNESNSDCEVVDCPVCSGPLEVEPVCLT